MTLAIYHDAGRCILNMGQITDKDALAYEMAKLRLNQNTQVTASEMELDYIKRNFSGIPMTSGPVITWYGDDACFIVSNL